MKFVETKNFLFGAGIIFITGAVLFFLFPENFFESELFMAYLWASAINIANFSLALVFYSFGIKSENNSVFLKSALGGMVFRLFFIIFLIFILIKFLNIQKSSFILIFFINYFILLIVEINFYLKKLKREAKKNANSGNS